MGPIYVRTAQLIEPSRAWAHEVFPEVIVWAPTEGDENLIDALYFFTAVKRYFYLLPPLEHERIFSLSFSELNCCPL